MLTLPPSSIGQRIRRRPLARAPLLVAGAMLACNLAQAQPNVPNLADKKCALWIASSERAKTDPDVSPMVQAMDWWALGFVKGAAMQIERSERTPNPLRKLPVARMGAPDPVLEPMRAYCRTNPQHLLSDAALALLDDLRVRD